MNFLLNDKGGRVKLATKMLNLRDVKLAPADHILLSGPDDM